MLWMQTWRIPSSSGALYNPMSQTHWEITKTASIIEETENYFLSTATYGFTQSSISELVMIDYGKLQLKMPAGGFTSLQTSEIQSSDISQWKQLPAGLRHLQIIKCDSAETLLEERTLQTNNSFLKVLVINSCSFSRCFHRVGLPTTLRTLHIYRSTKLDFLLPELFKCLLPFLEQLWIRLNLSH